MKVEQILEKLPTVVAEWSEQRSERQQRTKADPADYQQLREIGIPLLAVPVEFGGTWENLAKSARTIGTMLRTLAQGDPSITLASSMHQGVLASWRVPAVPEPYNGAWQIQRREVFSTVTEGAWWGTIVSEPGSGGDTGKTQSLCIQDTTNPSSYLLSGQKHFGSGSGLTSFMTTRAIPNGESEPDLFFMEVRDQPWDGSTGIRLAAEWRGHGMSSTNSHAFEFTNFPATRIAWPGHQTELMAGNGSLGGMSFTSVIVGVVDAAMAYTKTWLKTNLANGSSLRAFQQVEWTMAEQEYWLIEQAWESGMRSFDSNTLERRTVLLAKENVARLASSVLDRLCKLSGGTAYTKYSPLGTWLQDVRALGYLRPPWALAFDTMFNMSLED
jgi:alkylation response protein AidB-like acyl-CoA dehydrogenase